MAARYAFRSQHIFLSGRYSQGPTIFSRRIQTVTFFYLYKRVVTRGEGDFRIRIIILTTPISAIYREVLNVVETSLYFNELIRLRRCIARQARE